MIEFPVMRSPLQVQRKKSEQCHKLIENLHIRTFHRSQKQPWEHFKAFWTLLDIYKTSDSTVLFQNLSGSQEQSWEQLRHYPCTYAWGMITGIIFQPAVCVYSLFCWDFLHIGHYSRMITLGISSCRLLFSKMLFHMRSKTIMHLRQHVHDVLRAGGVGIDGRVFARPLQCAGIRRWARQKPHCEPLVCEPRVSHNTHHDSVGSFIIHFHHCVYCQGATIMGICNIYRTPN